VSKVKQDEDQEYNSPFDNRGEYKHREPVRAGVPIENPTGPPSKDPDDIEANFHDDKIEVNFHAADATRQVHQAYQEASNLNKMYVYEGEGMPDDEVETVEEEDETKEDLEANTPPVETKPKPNDYSKYRRQFLHMPLEKIKKTFAATTQNAASIAYGPKANQTLKSPNPALNIRRRKEAVATDSLFADVPAVDTPGCTGAQIFVGRSSLLTDCYGFCSVSECPNTLLDNIRERGAMDTLISDHANYEMSARVKDVLRSLMIRHWKSEPYYQHQNFAEHRWGHVKSNLEWLMAFLDVDPDCWLLALNYVCSVMNLTAEKILGWRTPQEVATSETPDICILLCFMFWDIVYCAIHANKQPVSQKGQEIRGCFVGFAWDVGHKLTFLVLSDDTRKVIKRSILRLANCPENEMRLDENNL